MELTQLRQFKMITECGTMTQAAEELSISQPALSTMLKKLEEELGVSLFDRTKNKITINEAGQLALRYTNEILERAEAMKSELHDFERRERVIKAGFCDPGPLWYCTPVFSMLRPDLELNARLIDSGDRTENLLYNHTYDFVMTTEPVKNRDVVSVPVLKDRVMLSVYRDSPIASMDSISIREYKPDPILIYYVGGEFFEKQRKFWDEMKDEIRLIQIDDYFMFRQRMLSSNETAQSTQLARHLRDDGNNRILIPTTDSELEITYYLCYEKQSRKHLAPFLQWIKELQEQEKELTL